MSTSTLEQDGVQVPAADVWPSVGVVIVTGDRPNLVRRTLASVLRQDYEGPLRVVVVFDRSAPDWSLANGPDWSDWSDWPGRSARGERPVLVLLNWRTPGRAGALNTGIVAVGDCELVAVCDHTETWAPDKLTAQVTALRQHPDAIVATCAVEAEYGRAGSTRLARANRIGVAELADGWRRDAGGPSFVAYQRVIAADAAHGGIGLLCEAAPAGGEEWDLLLRAAQRSDIVHVDRPLVRSLRRPLQLDEAACARQARSMRWVLARHPGLRAHYGVLSRLAAQIAWLSCAGGDRRSARHFAGTALRASWWHPRGLLAVAASRGLLPAWALRALLRRTYRLAAPPPGQNLRCRLGLGRLGLSRLRLSRLRLSRLRLSRLRLSRLKLSRLRLSRLGVNAPATTGRAHPRHRAGAK